MTYLLGAPNFFGTDDDGRPLEGGKLYTYAPLSSTPKATYSDASLVHANTNPVILNSRGEAAVYLSGATKLVLTASDGDPSSPIWTWPTAGNAADAPVIVYPEWYTVNTVPGTTDMTTAIQAAFDTGQPVDFTAGPYLFSATLTPKHNSQIRFLNGATLIADAGGTYTEMLTAAGGSTGLYVLFDCIELGVLLSVSNNRNTTLVENLLIDANSIANTIGVGQTKCWVGTEPAATSPMVTFINPNVVSATWGYYAEDSPYPTAGWGQFTGSTFINASATGCANGAYWGSAQDDITVINLRVTSSTGVSLKVAGGGKNVVSAFLNPTIGNGLVIESGSFSNHFGTIFIESSGAIPVTDYPVVVNGIQGSYLTTAYFECDSLLINYPDGTGSGAGMRKWIFVAAPYDSVRIKTLFWPLGTSLSYVYHLWLDFGTALPTPSHHEIGWCKELSSFVLGLNSAAATYVEQTRWYTNVRLTAQDGAGTYYGFKFIKDGDNQLDYQTDVTLPGDACRLNAYGLRGLIYKNTSGANLNMGFLAPDAVPADGELFRFVNSISSDNTVTLTAGATAAVLGAGSNVLAIGQSADFAYRASDGLWVQLNRY